jgi:TolB-like protein
MKTHDFSEEIVMVRTLRRALLLVVAAAFSASNVAAQAKKDTRPGVAVMPFAKGISIGANKEDLDALSVGLQQILITELAQNSTLRLVERGMIRDILAEQDLGAANRIDAQTAARVGKIVGARYAFTGGFNDVSGTFRLDGHLVDVETSEIIKAEEVTDKRDKLYEIVMNLSKRITTDLKLPALEVTVQEGRKQRANGGIPREAVILYSQAQFFQDRGQKEKAKELYRRITNEFPKLTEAQEALKQLEKTE